MSIENLNLCSRECLKCVKEYKKKHDLKPGEQFKISCPGIPKEYIQKDVLNILPKEEAKTALSILDPVTWAAVNLDWHCEDLDGEIWKRKNPEEYAAWLKNNPDTPIEGKSRYHRPYQKLMLQCKSNRRISRCGRQCLTGDTTVTLSSGETKKIKDILIGDEVYSLNEKTCLFESSKVIDSFSNGIKQVYEITTSSGHKVEATSDHPFLTKEEKADKSDNYLTKSNPLKWESLKDGLKKGSHIAIAKTLNISKEGSIYWDRIKDIKLIGNKEVFDISLDSNFNFIANSSIIAHNCGKTDALCIFILYNAFIKPGKSQEQAFNIIVITPYIAQIGVVFNRLKELINSNPNLANAVTQNTKAPTYKIELANGSIIQGFTAGTRSGGNADSVRGNHADILLYDECDYLSSGDIDSSMAMITNQVNATVWMSSTPTGRRERFYQNSFSRLWKEFHFPSSVNPMWTKELEDGYREQFTAAGYEHEILANFGEIEEGVFQHSYIQDSLSDYEYGSKPYNPEWTYTIGVDWNDVKNGTCIYVIGFDPINGRFYGVERDKISKVGWTQTVACERIIELNRKWRPSAIYIDRGFGHMQNEVLIKYGWDALADPKRGKNHQDSKLRDIVKQYDFGSTIEVHDFFTKLPIKKPAKPFLVENAIRRFESRVFSFPKSDLELEGQLNGYIIDHVSDRGVPVYREIEESKGDHVLDALMLALVAFTLEKTPLGSPTYENSISFTSNLREKGFQEKSSIHKKAGAEKHLNRWEGIEKESFLEKDSKLPANNVNIKQKEISYIHEGFLRDQPLVIKSLNFRRGNKPRRTNI